MITIDSVDHHRRPSYQIRPLFRSWYRLPDQATFPFMVSASSGPFKAPLPSVPVSMLNVSSQSSGQQQPACGSCGHTIVILCHSILWHLSSGIQIGRTTSSPPVHSTSTERISIIFWIKKVLNEKGSESEKFWIKKVLNEKSSESFNCEICSKKMASLTDLQQVVN